MNKLVFNILIYLLGHRKGRCIILWRTSSFPKYFYHFTFLLTKYEMFICSTSSLTFSNISLFDFSHCSGRKIISYSAFNLHFHDAQWCWISFLVRFGHSYIVFGLFKSFAHVCIRLTNVVVVYVYGYESFLSGMFCKRFPSLRLPIHFLSGVLLIFIKFIIFYMFSLF